jgi:RNA polymerase sigma factor (sigma-70 family)
MDIQQDAGPFEMLIERHKGILYKVANAYCKNEEDRKDLIQEIIIRLWQSRQRYNATYSMSTWVYRIALNTAISFYRKDTRRKQIALPVKEDILSLPDDTQPETELQLQLLQQFISELRELDRALILLYLEEKPYKEISEILGLSESNIATRIGRIKEKLKQRFGPYKP